LLNFCFFLAVFLPFLRKQLAYFCFLPFSLGSISL
jgi:hypothetical protein